jgi:hypothetical protein
MNNVGILNVDSYETSEGFQSHEKTVAKFSDFLYSFSDSLGKT